MINHNHARARELELELGWSIEVIMIMIMVDDGERRTVRTRVTCGMQEVAFYATCRCNLESRLYLQLNLTRGIGQDPFKILISGFEKVKNVLKLTTAS